MGSHFGGGQRATRRSKFTDRYNAAGYLFAILGWPSSRTSKSRRGTYPEPGRDGNAKFAAVVAPLEIDPGYVTAFQNAFPADKDALTYDNLGRRSELSNAASRPPCALGQVPDGDKTALTAGEIEGLKIFTNVAAWCVTPVSCGGNSTSERAPSRPGLLR